MCAEIKTAGCLVAVHRNLEYEIVHAPRTRGHFIINPLNSREISLYCIDCGGEKYNLFWEDVYFYILIG